MSAGTAGADGFEAILAAEPDLLSTAKMAAVAHEMLAQLDDEGCPRDIACEIVLDSLDEIAARCTPSPVVRPDPDDGYCAACRARMARIRGCFTNRHATVAACCPACGDAFDQIVGCEDAACGRCHGG